MANRPKFRRRKRVSEPDPAAFEDKTNPAPSREGRTDRAAGQVGKTVDREAKADAEAKRRAAAARKAEIETRQQEAAEAARHEAERLEAQAGDVAKISAAKRSDAAHSRKRAATPPPLTLTDPIDLTNGPDAQWRGLKSFTVRERHLELNRIITASRHNPAHAAFDVLRTRLLQALSDRGWKRVAITSPTQDCGKTFTAANLAISLSRQENCRTLLLDFDLRRPSLHSVMGFANPGSIGDMLRGATHPGDHLVRMGKNTIHAGRNIAFGFNDTTEPYAAELLQDPRTRQTLAAIERDMAPDVMLFDLPPALLYDDVIAFRPMFDGVLLVVGGGMSTDKEIKQVEHRLGEDTPLLGMVLNKAEGSSVKKYNY
ncbi:CpsD/CapB family tyrosine-protein kinase [Thalassococcus sp. CAU 1522]|uniref:CpsD/CapB family tyrosine-protein kinase n=1 Tax=Thalassococcus arenae TaxID=2851652 RepID=A0ABS6N6B1_9RHOB|nr:CpsD/CapB family tyrosine-protein kinase [Thalassococcus arenae]